MRILEGKVLERTRLADGSEKVVNYAEIAGLSTEQKPTENLGTGSVFYEVDTNTAYSFDEATGLWFAAENGKTPVTGATVTLGSALTWTGEEQTQAVSAVVVGASTLTSGTDYTVVKNKATEPGTYTLYIVGRGDYCGVAEKSFTVAKADSTLTADPDTLSLTILGEGGESGLTIVGDGELTVESSAETVATAELVFTPSEDEDAEEGEGTWSVAVTQVGVGSATVTVKLAAGAHYAAATETISVTVAKEDGTVVADPDTLSLTAGGADGTSALTVEGDGEVSVASSDETVATAAVADGVVTVTPVAEGTATVTVTLAAGDVYDGGTDTISVTVAAAAESEGT